MQILNSPLDITGGAGERCVLWLDGSDASTMRENFNDGTANVENNDRVGYWSDKSTSGLIFSTGDSTRRPTYVQSLSSIRFDRTLLTGLSSRVPNSGNTANFFLNPSTIFLVLAPVTLNSRARIFSTNRFGQTGDDINTAGALIPFNISINSPFRVGTRNNVDINTDPILGLGFLANTLSGFEVLVQRSTSLANGFNNYFNFVPVAGSYTNQSHKDILTLGVGSIGGAAGSFDSNCYDGFITELIVYNYNISPSDFIRVSNYLGFKYSGLNLNRPVIALKSMSFNDSTSWSISAYPSPYNLPLPGDVIFTNNNVVDVTSNINVNRLGNRLAVPFSTAGGYFLLSSNNVSITANEIVSDANPYLIGLSGNNNCNIRCSIVRSNASNAISGFGNFLCNLSGFRIIAAGGTGIDWNSTNTLNITSNVFHQPSWIGINQRNGTINLLGDVNVENSGGTGGQGGRGIQLTTSTSTCNITGNIYRQDTGSGFILRAIFNSGNVNITGDVYGALATDSVITIENNLNCRIRGNIYGSPVQNSNNVIANAGTLSIEGNIINNRSRNTIGNTSRLSIVGNVYGSFAGAAISSTSTLPVSVAGNIIFDETGMNPVRAISILMYPISENFKNTFVSGSSLNGRISLPTNVSNFTLLPSFNFSKIVCGSNFAIAQSANTFRWFGSGDNSQGVFGQGNTSNFTTFTILTGEWSNMFASYNRVFALSANTNQWFVAGNNDFGQLGLGYISSPVTSFTQITGNWDQFVGGEFHTLGLSADRQRWHSVGRNHCGQLSLNDTINRTTFTLISGNYTKISCGLNHTVALSSQEVRVWGSNAQGEIGLGSSLLSAFSAVIISGRYSDVACGDNFSFILSTGTSNSMFRLYSTGNNSVGQLAQGNNINRTSFTLVTAGFWEAVVCGGSFVFARDINSGLWAAAGNNSEGQLGIGTTTNTNTFLLTGTNKNLEIICGSNFVYGLDTIYKPQFIEMPLNFPFLGEKLSLYTEDTTFSFPLTSDVVLNTVYGFGTLTGAMIVPPISSVNQGVKVGTQIGTAYLSVNDFWNTPLSSINYNNNTIGEYLAKTLTLNSISALTNSLDFSKI